MARANQRAGIRGETQARKTGRDGRRAPKLIEPSALASELGLLAEKIAVDPWEILWEKPYLHVLQLLHFYLRTNDAWTVTIAPPAPSVSEDAFAHLLAEDEDDGDTDAWV